MTPDPPRRPDSLRPAAADPPGPASSAAGPPAAPSDPAVLAAAAVAALDVPGVVALAPDLTDLVGRVAHRRPGRTGSGRAGSGRTGSAPAPPVGVSARWSGAGGAVVGVDLIVRIGVVVPAVAREVQRVVAAAVAAQGLVASVEVNVVGIAGPG